MSKSKTKSSAPAKKGLKSKDDFDDDFKDLDFFTEDSFDDDDDDF